jgi:hypothetical protein
VAVFPGVTRSKPGADRLPSFSTGIRNVLSIGSIAPCVSMAQVSVAHTENVISLTFVLDDAGSTDLEFLMTSSFHYSCVCGCDTYCMQQSPS